MSLSKSTGYSFQVVYHRLPFVDVKHHPDYENVFDVKA